MGESAVSAYPPPGRSELHLPAQLTILATILLQLVLPDRLVAGPRWMWPAIEGTLLAVLFLSAPQRLEAPHSVRRMLSLSATAVVGIANGIALALLAHYLLHHDVPDGYELIIAGAEIWLTNVFIFALWYWEMDRGGPGRRAAGLDGPPDFLFPQMTELELFGSWRPQFLDYLYVGLTNASAFSPTDTMPLSVQAKMVMGFQGLVSLVTIGLVVSRAVNIL
ncbi:MAG TPA: hypothetical protein VHV75_13960 [Solirubrobacteraceae bacterium]|jgi:hypothetical protein|nr:hypothetical protein [Solirubrobacteraceae bacterium]